MERPNKGLALAALVAGMSRATGGAAASMMAFRDALLGRDTGISRGNRIGPGRRSTLTMRSMMTVVVIVSIPSLCLRMIFKVPPNIAAVPLVGVGNTNDAIV